jgi:CRISP-associated protein Cas1
MIQLPDFKQKQILFFNAADLKSCDLKLRNENILILEAGKTKDKIPANRLLAIFVIGDTTITSKLIQKLTRVGASLFLLKRNLETYATIGSYAEGNYLLRQKQYHLSEERKFIIGKKIVKNKLINQLALLRSAGIKKINKRSLVNCKNNFKNKIKKADDISTLRGIEGSVGRDYFRAYFSKIGWYKRVPRGKIDENNILLDMGYNFLFHFTDSLLRLYGFDTYKGVYHQLFFQRKSLSCDMMEPFRCIIDRALFKMYRLKQFNKKDFIERKGQYYLSYKNSDKYAKIFLKEILRYKKEIYNYVRDYYYFTLNDEGEIREFLIR